MKPPRARTIRRAEERRSERQVITPERLQKAGRRLLREILAMGRAKPEGQR